MHYCRKQFSVHHSGIIWALWNFKSLATQSIIQQFVQSNQQQIWKKLSELHITDPLEPESTSDGWISVQNGQ